MTIKHMCLVLRMVLGSLALMICGLVVTHHALAQHHVEIVENKVDRQQKVVRSITLKRFTRDLKKANKRKFTEEKFKAFTDKYRAHLLPVDTVSDSIPVDLMRFNGKVEGVVPAKRIDFTEFKSSKNYRKIVKKLFESDKTYRRRLSYLLLGALNDSTYLGGMRARLKEPQIASIQGERDELLFGLLRLRDDHVSALFDAVAGSTEMDVDSVLPLFLALNSDSLRNVASPRLVSENRTEKTLAAACLSVAPLTPDIEKALKSALQGWEGKSKKYPLVTLAELGASEMLAEVKSYLEDGTLRSLSYRALARSQTSADRQYLLDICDTATSPDPIIVNSLSFSTDEQLIIKWLGLVEEGKATVSDEFLAMRRPILWSEKVLPALEVSIERTNRKEESARLVSALGNAESAPALQLLGKLLTNQDVDIRRAAIAAISGKHREDIRIGLLQELSSPSLRLPELVDRIIEYPIDSLQPYFASIMADNPSGEWNKAAFKYIAAKPLEEHRALFNSVITNMALDMSYVGMAQNGLIALGDSIWVNAVIIQMFDGRLALTGKDAERFHKIEEKDGFGRALAAFVNRFVRFNTSPTSMVR